MKIFFATCMLLITASCSSPSDSSSTYQCPMACEGEKTYDDTGACPVCHMDLLTTASLTPELSEIGHSESSIFNLTSQWHTEEGEKILLEELKGQTLVMVMIYTTCKAACPRLVADMRRIEELVAKEGSDDVRYVLISIDPETDNPERLKAFAIENSMNGPQWTFLQGTIHSVRELANVLAVKYKLISPMDFSHSNIISVFNAEGILVHQQEGLGVDNEVIVQQIIKT